LKQALILVGGLVAVALLVAKREEVASVGASVGDSIVSAYFALTEDSRANEERFAPAIQSAEIRNSIPAGLLHRQLFEESRFRSDVISGEVVSAAGAVGIAQIIPRFHPGVDPLDAFQSIDYAARYLRENFERFGSWILALAAYNAGPGNVVKYNGIPPFPETQKYVAAITRDVEVA